PRAAALRRRLRRARAGLARGQGRRAFLDHRRVRRDGEPRPAEAQVVMVPRTRSTAARRSGAGEQLTITGFLDNLSRKAEVHDPLRPATRLFLVVLALSGLGFLMQASFVATTHAPEEFWSEMRGQGLLRVLSICVMLLAFRLGPGGLRRIL